MKFHKNLFLANCLLFTSPVQAEIILDQKVEPKDCVIHDRGVLFRDPNKDYKLRRKYTVFDTNICDAEESIAAGNFGEAINFLSLVANKTETYSAANGEIKELWIKSYLMLADIFYQGPDEFKNVNLAFEYTQSLSEHYYSPAAIKLAKEMLYSGEVRNFDHAKIWQFIKRNFDARGYYGYDKKVSELFKAIKMYGNLTAKTHIKRVELKSVLFKIWHEADRKADGEPAYYFWKLFPNDRFAIQALNNAAERGHIEANYDLGASFSTNNPLIKNENDAIKYLTIAANGGHAKAQEAIDAIDEKRKLKIAETRRLAAADRAKKLKEEEAFKAVLENLLSIKDGQVMDSANLLSQNERDSLNGLILRNLPELEINIITVENKSDKELRKIVEKISNHEKYFSLGVSIENRRFSYYFSDGLNFSSAQRKDIIDGEVVPFLKKNDFFNAYKSSIISTSNTYNKFKNYKYEIALQQNFKMCYAVPLKKVKSYCGCQETWLNKNYKRMSLDEIFVYNIWSFPGTELISATQKQLALAKKRGYGSNKISDLRNTAIWYRNEAQLICGDALN